MNALEHVREKNAVNFALQSIWSLGQDCSDRNLALYRDVYEENASISEQHPLNTKANIIGGVLQAIESRDIVAPYPIGPYWLQGRPFNPIEVFGATIQCVDQHDAPLPKTVLPPEDDVCTFLDQLFEQDDRADITTQFELLLDITGNNIVGAANLGWIATRFMARAADQRAYPGILIDHTKLREWNQRIAQFSQSRGEELNDGPGDNYYFWTHAFGTIAYSQGGICESMAQTALKHGTQIMMFVRKNIARKPNITPHKSASEIGHEVGLILARASTSL